MTKDLLEQFVKDVVAEEIRRHAKRRKRLRDGGLLPNATDNDIESPEDKEKEDSTDNDNDGGE